MVKNCIAQVYKTSFKATFSFFCDFVRRSEAMSAKTVRIAKHVYLRTQQVRNIKAC